MIERAAGCLEKGGTCLSRAALRTPLRSHRLLHSTFWTHGAGSIDLPSWWIALLQLPHAKEASEIHRRNTTPTFLEFLYPPRTLEIIQQQGNTDSAVSRRQRRTRAEHQPRSRAYASLTADALLSKSEDATPVEAETSADEHQAEASLDRQPDEGALLDRLDQLLLFDDPESDLSGLWTFYLELRRRSIILHRRQTVKFLRCLARSDSGENQKRVLELFFSLPNDERKSIHYSYAISAALNHNNIEAAVRLHAEALSQIHVSVGTSSLLSYAIEREYWQIAIETWQMYWKHKEVYFERPDIWVGVDTIPLPELWARASSAVDFAAAMTAIADSGAAASSREFALQLSLRSFARRSSVDNAVHRASSVYGLRRISAYRVRDVHRKLHARILKPRVTEVQYPNIERHQQLFERAVKLQAPTLDIYEAAIHQVLSFKSRLYTTQALKYYQDLREKTYITPPPDLLEALLDQLCSVHSEAGMLLILNDYRYYHQKLSAAMFRRALPEFANQGNRKAVEGLVKEFRLQFNKFTHSIAANAILHVCYARGEVKRAVETFDKMETFYKFKPDLNSYNAVIRTHVRVGDIEGAAAWYNRLLDARFKPDHRTLVPLMAMFAKRGDIDAVKQLLRQSERYGVETNIAMIDTLVLAQVNNDQLSAAETLVKDALETSEEVPQSSRTRMWNYLLNAFAMRGDLDKITELHRAMRANNIPSNETTFAALMHGLSIKRQAAGAYQILTDIMPQMEIPATALHYSICMSGYLLLQQYRKVFVLYADMLKEDVRPDIGVHNLLIRAAAAIDKQEHELKEGAPDQQQYEAARHAFEQALNDLDPMQLATSDPIKFVGVNRLDESFSSSYFSYLIFLYGRQKAMDQVKDLYERYTKTKSDLHMDVEDAPPIQMLSALMVAHLKNQDHQAMDECWMMSLAGAQKLARRVGAKVSEPGWVLPARRFILNVHLRHYMRSLIQRSRHKDVQKTLEHLHQCGYELDSKSWNMYVQTMVEDNQILLAFETCEKELMSGWEGWEPSNVRYIKKALRFRQPRRLEPHRRLPSYETLVYLAAAFVDAQSSISVKGGKPMSQQLYSLAPKTVDAVYHLPRFNDSVQSRLLER